VETPRSEGSIKICLITSKHAIRDSRVFGCFYQGIVSAGGEAIIIGPFTDEGDRAGDVRSVCLPVSCSANQDTLGSPRLACQRLMALAHLFRWCLRLRPDVIQACEPDSWVVAWLAARAYGGRAVFDVHEMYPAYLAGKFRSSWRPRAEARLIGVFRWLLARADAVFHVSAERKAYYMAPEGNHFVVPSYPSLRIAEISRDSRDRGAIDFVHLGKVVEPESRRVLLGAMARCRAAGRPFTVAIVGQRLDEFNKGLRADQLAAVDGMLRWCAPLPHRQALEIAATARLGLALYDSDTASRNIVASRKLYEYMALGLPVIGTRVAGVTELIEGNGIGIVVPLEAEALASAMLRLAGDPELARRCAAAGRAAFLERYNWEAQSGWLMSAYASLSAYRRRGGRKHVRFPQVTQPARDASSVLSDKAGSR